VAIDDGARRVILIDSITGGPKPMPYSEDQLLALVDGHMPGLLGVEISDMSQEAVRARLGWRPEITGDGLVVHGGALMTLADILGSFGTALNLPEGSATATIESKTNFMRGVRSGTIEASSLPLHRGRHSMVWQTTITQDDKLVAQTTQTQIVIYS
jgi:uncharacterized protein (TIGR00369 family)